MSNLPGLLDSGVTHCTGLEKALLERGGSGRVRLPRLFARVTARRAVLCGWFTRTFGRQSRIVFARRHLAKGSEPTKTD